MTNHRYLVLALVAVFACKSKDDKAPAPTPSPAPAAPAPKAPEPPAPEAPAAKPVEPAPPAPAAPVSIKLPELPSGWDRTDEADGSTKLEYLAATNQTKFPADNAIFTFTLGAVTDDAAPKTAAAYGDWHAGATKDKVLKTEKLGDAIYFEFHGPGDATDADRYFHVVTLSSGKLLRCGGSLYRDKDYNQIPKIRDAAIAQAKKLCAAMTL